MKLIFKRYPYELISIILLLVYFSPLLFLESSKYLMHDNLDSNLVWYKNLAESGKMFANGNSIVDNMMLGIPRACYPTEWSVDHLMYLIFPAQIAYNFNYFFLHLVAFIGMRLMLKDFVSKSPVIYNFVALSFAFIPFWPSGYLTVAGLPFLCYALLKIFKDQSKPLHWCIILCFPFFSSLLFGNLFSFPILFLFFLFEGHFEWVGDSNFKGIKVNGQLYSYNFMLA